MRNHEPILMDTPAEPDEGPQRIGGKKSGVWWVTISIAVMVVFVSSALLSRALAPTLPVAPSETALSAADSAFGLSPADSAFEFSSAEPASGLGVSIVDSYSLYDPTVVSSSDGNSEPLQVPSNWSVSHSLSSDTTASGDYGITLELDPSEAGLLAVHALCTGSGRITVSLEPDSQDSINPYPAEVATFTCTPGGEEARVIFPNQGATALYQMLMIQVISVPDQAPPTWTVNLEIPS